MYFYVNEFEIGVNDSISSGNEQQKVYYTIKFTKLQIYWYLTFNNVIKLQKSFQTTPYFLTKQKSESRTQTLQKYRTKSPVRLPSRYLHLFICLLLFKNELE